MSLVNSSLFRRFAAAAGLGLAALSLQAQVRDGLEVQRGRTEKLKARGSKVYYTPEWSLDDLPRYQAGPQVTGTIREWGSNYFADSHLGAYWEEGFHKYQPGVSFDYHLKTTLTAVLGLVVGVADLAPSRHITFDETLGFERVFSHSPTEITVVTGSFNVPGWNYALAVVVNKKNPITQLSFRQLDGIFGAERDGGYQGTTWHSEIARGPDGNIRTWGQAGLTGEWADKPIHVHAYNLRYHIPRTFERLVFQGADKWNEQMHEYANYKKPDGSTMLEAVQTMDAVDRDPCAIGYSSIEYLTPRTKALALAVKEEGPYVPMTLKTVQDRSYPLFDEVYFYLNREPGQPADPKLKEFLRYVLSREGQEAVQRDGKYLPLTAEVVREQLKKLE